LAWPKHAFLSSRTNLQVNYIHEPQPFEPPL
jgi:hypothetical protein